MRKTQPQACGIAGATNWPLTIILILLIIPILIFGFAEGRKAYWDNEIRKLCDSDGGLKVYEKVTLNDEQYNKYVNQFGNLTIPREEQAPEQFGIVSRDSITLIRRNNPTVRRHELMVIRKSDNKILSEKVTYSRVGGDIFAFHSSYFSCPEIQENIWTATLIRADGN